MQTPLLTRGRLVAASVATTVTAAALVVVAGPAFADNVPATPNGQNGSTAPISTVAILLLFVGIPVVIFIVAAIFLMPERSVGALKYRPGRSWGFDREWFGTRPERVVGDVPDTGPGAAPVFQAGGANGSW